MKLPDTGISIPLVMKTLGAKTNRLDLLCSHRNINKWSRWKPYPYNSKQPITEQIITSLGYGILPAAISPGEIPATEELETTMFICSHLGAPAGDNEPFRLDDFKNYNHDAPLPCEPVQFSNDKGGIIPISGNNAYPLYHPVYSCRMQMNIADISLSELICDTVSLSDLYLTLIISPNLNGMSFSDSLIAQSTKSVGEAVTERAPYLIVEIDTFTLSEKLLTPANIVFAYLAPKMTDETAFVPGVSLKLDDTYKTTLYNDSFHTYADGTSGGGNPPVSQANGAWAWFSNNPAITRNLADNTGTMTFDMLKYTVSKQALGEGALRVFITELNIDMRITQDDNIHFYSSGERIIDTTVTPVSLGSLIDTNTLLPYESLHCRFYVASLSAYATVSFNVEDMIISITN